jgi:hypothetical protein
MPTGVLQKCDAHDHRDVFDVSALGKYEFIAV